LNTRLAGCCYFAAVNLWCAAAATDAESQSALRLKQTIALPGVEGRIDHFAFDGSGQRLFICALGNNTLEVIDLRKGERIRSITGLGSPQGVGYLPDLDRVLVANDQGGICKIYDGKSFQQTGKIDLKDDADNVRYDATAKKIYVGFANGGIAIIDPAAGRQIGSIKLSAHPEAFVLEKSGSRIFANVPNSHRVAVINRDERKMTAMWGTDLAFANFPMALDEANHRLFIGCRMPSRLLVLNTDSGEVIAKTEISGDCDDLFYDSKRHCIYAICGAGKIDLIEQTDPNTYRSVANIDTASGARTGLFVPQLDELFVAVPHRGSQQAEVRAYHFQ
jgi:DNA-binding beta-propeller fold protein YncE